MFFAIAFTVSLATFGVASPHRKWPKAQVYKRCTVPNTAALTFDDGPFSYTNEIVNTLNDAGAKGTFFFNGNNYGCIYDADKAQHVKNAYDNGHQVGSHTWSHADLTQISASQLNSELERVEQAIEKITGAVPGFMRPPFGNYNDDVLEAAGVLGEAVVLWDLDSGDSTGSSVQQSENIYNAAISKHPSTILSLNHETVETTVKELLPYAISKLQAAGYKLITVADCLGKEPYTNIGSPSRRDSSWKC